MNGDEEEEARASVAAMTLSNGDNEKEKNEADEHIAKHVQDQLERIRSNESAVAYEDEFEAQLDGQ